jgi:hypothetical protein
MATATTLHVRGIVDDIAVCRRWQANKQRWNMRRWSQYGLMRSRNTCTPPNTPQSAFVNRGSLNPPAPIAIIASPTVLGGATDTAFHAVPGMLFLTFGIPSSLRAIAGIILIKGEA